MELADIGELFLEYAEHPLTKLTMKCLGYTALSLQALLDEANGIGCEERWGYKGDEE